MDPANNPFYCLLLSGAFLLEPESAPLCYWLADRLPWMDWNLSAAIF